MLDSIPAYLIPYTDDQFKDMHKHESKNRKLINFKSKQVDIQPIGIFTIRIASEEKIDNMPTTHFAWVIKHPKSYKGQLNLNSYGITREIALQYLINFIKG